MKTTILLAMLMMTVLSGIAQDKQTDYTEALKLIEVWLDAQRDYDRVPGMSVLIVDDQEVLWSGAFGMANMEDQVKATPSTLYSICSISKLFTSVAIMKLYDEGKLRLDDEVDDLLPWYDLKQKYKDSWPITIRTLLTHSSGLPRESNHPYWTGPDHPFPESESIKSELHNQETLYPSSTYFQYSNLGLTLLGEVVSAVSGMPYEEYIKLHILDPLNLQDTRTFLPEEQYGTTLAVGYTTLNREGTREKVNLFQAKGIKAAAGFSSNVSDLGKFASWQFRLLDTTTTEILQPSTLKYMHNVHWTDPDWKTTWGLGFWMTKGQNEEKWVGHSGGCPGYSTLFNMIPAKKRAYAVFTNGLNTNRTGYINGMHSILEKYKKEGKKESGNDPAHELDEYEGYYSQLPWTSEVYLTSWHNKLVMLSLPSKDPAETLMVLKYIKDDTFKRLKDNGELGEAYE
ncbi:MAG: beta-lactamase family protein, partial [Bacteroidales bacterium]|nr:beta-lactamase family protein [Bacteroidales bacterium]